MSSSTNKLVANAKRVAAPAGAAATIALAAAFVFHYNGVHAASSAAAPLDDSSVSSLTALDSAVEAVAARVTPAVVNVAVTSEGSSEQRASAEDQEGGEGLPPGLSQFFGQGRGGRAPEQQQLQH